MTWNGIDLSGVLSILVTIITGLLGWAATSLQKKASADAAASRAATAVVKLGQIGLAMATDAWQTLAPAIQSRLADGTFSAEDRKDVEGMVAQLMSKYTSSEELEKITSALGLPLPGIIAQIAAFIIDRVTKAHDPDLLTGTASPMAFPVARTFAAQDDFDNRPPG